MLKNLLSIITLSLIFSLDTDWKLHQNHEISMNKLIIKIDDAQAPKLVLKSLYLLLVSKI